MSSIILHCRTKFLPRIRINYLMSKYRPTAIFRTELGKLLMNVVELDAVEDPRSAFGAAP